MVQFNRSRRGLLAAVATFPVAALALPKPVQAGGAELDALVSTWMQANTRLSNIQWVDDTVAVRLRGREPTDAETAEFNAAAYAEEWAYDALVTYEPRTLAALHAKANLFGSDGSRSSPFYLDADPALSFITTDIARLAGAI